MRVEWQHLIVSKCVLLCMDCWGSRWVVVVVVVVVVVKQHLFQSLPLHHKFQDLNCPIRDRGQGQNICSS